MLLGVLWFLSGGEHHDLDTVALKTHSTRPVSFPFSWMECLTDSPK